VGTGRRFLRGLPYPAGLPERYEYHWSLIVRGQLDVHTAGGGLVST
jgi:hypothetical protein